MKKILLLIISVLILHSDKLDDKINSYINSNIKNNSKIKILSKTQKDGFKVLKIKYISKYDREEIATYKYNTSEVIIDIKANSKKNLINIDEYIVTTPNFRKFNGITNRLITTENFNGDIYKFTMLKIKYDVILDKNKKIKKINLTSPKLIVSSKINKINFNNIKVSYKDHNIKINIDDISIVNLIKIKNIAIKANIKTDLNIENINTFNLILNRYNSFDCDDNCKNRSLKIMVESISKKIYLKAKLNLNRILMYAKDKKRFGKAHIQLEANINPLRKNNLNNLIIGNGSKYKIEISLDKSYLNILKEMGHIDNFQFKNGKYRLKIEN